MITWVAIITGILGIGYLVTGANLLAVAMLISFLVMIALMWLTIKGPSKGGKK